MSFKAGRLWSFILLVMGYFFVWIAGRVSGAGTQSRPVRRENRGPAGNDIRTAVQRLFPRLFSPHKKALLLARYLLLPDPARPGPARPDPAAYT